MISRSTTTLNLFLRLNFLLVCFVFGPYLPSSDSLLLNSFAGTSSLGSVSSAPNISTKNRATWIDRANELIAYRNKHGNTLVPKRYADNPALGQWVSKQRAQYRKYCANESPCSMTEEKIRLLDDIGFCWDAIAMSNRQRAEEDAWWLRYAELKGHGLSVGTLPQPLATFIRQQRQEYCNFQQGEPSRLDECKISALVSLDPIWWKNFHERQWDARCEELRQYCAEHGNCCVPINYENRKLANWVSNVRKKFRLKVSSGGRSTLTDEKIQQLNAVGFVWDRWDYEYETRYGGKLDS